MRTIATALPLLAATALLTQGSGSHGHAPIDKPLHLALVKGPVVKGTLRGGFGVKAEIPAEAFHVKVGAATLRFLDLDQDGKLAAGVDGMALDEAPFVVPIVPELLLHEGQFKVEFEGTQQITLTPEDLGSVNALVADASVLTGMRLHAGLQPFAIDATASAEARKHCDYLVKNGTDAGSAGISIHEEDPSKPGYTPDGARAGKASDIWPMPTSLHDAIEGFYASVWHGVPIVDPGSTRVGVAFVENRVAMLHFGPLLPPDVDFVHPANGATGIPCAFCAAGEAPNPVADTRSAAGCGYPIVVILSGKLGALESAELVDPKGKRVAGTFSSPEHPANPAWPSNSNCAAFIPAKPLLPATTYRARFKFASAAEPLAWSFTTRR